MATINSSATRITISGNYKSLVSNSGSTSTTIQCASGDVPASGDAGRFLMWKNGLITKDWEIRYIESATATTITVGDGGFSSAPGNGESFVISTNLADIATAEPVACTVTGKAYSFNGRDWSLINGAFLADIDVSLDTEHSTSDSAWQAGNNCAVQFGRLTGGEANGSTITQQGCYISLNNTRTSNNSNVFGDATTEQSAGPIFNFYGCYIKSYTNSASNWAFVRGTGPLRLIGSIWDGSISGAFYNNASELADTKFRGNISQTSSWSIRATFIRPVSSVQFANGLVAFKTYESYIGVFRDTVFDLDSLDKALFLNGQSSGLTTLIDCTTITDSDIDDAGSGEVRQGKSVSYSITDSSGIGLTGAKVAIYDKTSAIQDTIKESTSGTVDEIVTIFNQYINSAPSLYKTPFDIRIRKYGYAYQDFQSAISEPIKQEFRLVSNSNILSTEVQASNITGIALEFTTRTVTITSNHDAQTFYDYYHYQLSQTTNMQYVEDFIRTGTAFDFDDWNITIDGSTYIGDLTTAGVITLLNGAIVNGITTDANGTTAPPKILTLSGLINGSDVVVLKAGTNTVLKDVDQGGTTFDYTYEILQNVDIGIIKPGYVTQYIYGYPLSSSNATLPITQRIDRNYE